MLFCANCAERNKWPQGLFRSYGPCEVCKTVGPCSEVPSKYLPDRASNDDRSQEER